MVAERVAPFEVEWWRPLVVFIATPLFALDSIMTEWSGRGCGRLLMKPIRTAGLEIEVHWQ